MPRADRTHHARHRDHVNGDARPHARMSLRAVWLVCALIVFLGAAASAQAATQPVVSAVWPRTGPPVGGTALTVVGSGFATGTPAVSVAGVGAGSVTVVSDRVLDVQTPALPGGGTATGPVVVTTTQGASASTSPLATFTYRSGPALAVPAYFYALTPAWAGLDGPPRTADLAVMNPASGPGAAPDPYYVQQVAASQAAGVDVIGYVDTAYGSRSLSTVEADITTYEQWYGVNGIFLDQAASDCQTEASYYAPLYAFIHAQAGLDVTALNPGGATSSCYAAASDVLMTFEGTPSALANGANIFPGYDPSRFWAAVYGANPAALPSVLSTLSADGVGNVFVTSLGLPNPYGGLPSYWNQEVTDVAGAAPPPPPPTQVAPAVTRQPTPRSVTVGQTATFGATASGTPVPSVQWQVSAGGGLWTAIAGATNTTLTLSSVTARMSGNQYRAVFTNGVGTPATTNAASLTVTPPPTAPVITSPSSLTTPAGQAFSFTVTATGTPLPTLGESGRLPRGVSFTAGPAGRATLTGRGYSRRGTTTFTIIATSGQSQTTQQFTLTLS